MTIEQELCKRLANVFEGVLNGVSIGGNWLPPKTGNPKGAEAARSVSMYIRVGTRNYETYTSRMAEIAVAFDFKATFASDADLSRTVAAYEATINRLEEWHSDIDAVKRDIILPGMFEPVGLRLAGNGDFDPKDEDSNRTFTQTITIKGRILNNELGS